MDALNQFATKFAGVLAIAGLILAISSVLAAIYFYYNPRRSKYSLSYKVFTVGLLVGSLNRIKNALNAKDKDAYPHFVDLWNSGGDPISHDVMREPIILALQSVARGKGVVLRSAEVVRETHPGVSKFATTLHENGAQLVWTHFDPGMAVRIKLSASELVGSDQIAVFGQGLRLDFKRIRNLSDIGGIPSLAQKAFVVGAPLSVAFALGGPLMERLTGQEVNGLNAYLAFASLVVLFFVGLVCAIVSGFALNNLVEWAFNKKSPVEKMEGEPSLYDGHDRDQIFEMRRAELEAISETLAAQTILSDSSKGR